MHRLILVITTTALAFLLLAPPAWAEWVWPVRGEVITPYRNGSDPYASGQHRGIDIAGPTGAPVVAATDGEVRFAGTAGSSGLTVSIRTADGRLDTSYLHLSSTTVREGDRVSAGERVGAVGTTGVRSAAAPHLHLGVRDAGSRHAYHDPLSFLPPPPAPPQTPRAAPAPAPQPAPVAPSPAPAPVWAPAERRVPVEAPATRRVPAGSPGPRAVPVRAPAARLVPSGNPQGHRAPVHAPGGAGAPAHGLAAEGGRVTAPSAPLRTSGASPAGKDALGEDREPMHSPASGAAGLGPQEPDRVAGHPPTPGPAAQARTGSGPDVGLVLACLGLLAAAALLGLTQEGQGATKRAGRRIARVLMPALGRR